MGFITDSQAWFHKIAEEQCKNCESEVFSQYDEEKYILDEIAREAKRTFGEDLSLEAFLQELQMGSKESAVKPNTVSLMTIHGANGKEFMHDLIGLVDDEPPSFQAKKKGSNSLEMEEEKRNCFVAITRAMKTLTLKYAKRYRGWSKNPSRFLYEMGLLT